MNGFVGRLHELRFLRACDPSYRALTFTPVGLPPTGYISLLLDILFGSFPRALVVMQPQSTRVEGADIVMKSSPVPLLHIDDFRFYQAFGRLAKTSSQSVFTSEVGQRSTWRYFVLPALLDGSPR
jgi:hypothetical protein